MLALRLLVTATLTAWAVTTYKPEKINKLSKQQQWQMDKQHLQNLHSSVSHYSENVHNFSNIHVSKHELQHHTVHQVHTQIWAM